MKLSILIPSLPMRTGNFLARIVDELDYQIEELGRDDIELLVYIDNKKWTLGRKRNALIGLSVGDFIAFVDDDDRVSEDYVATIIKTIDENPDADCIVYDVFCTVSNSLDSKVKSFSFVCKYGVEFEYVGHTETTPWYGKPAQIMIWNRKIMEEYHFPDVTLKEDFIWVKTAWGSIKKQIRIDKILYYYDYDAATSQSLDYQYVEKFRKYMTAQSRKRLGIKIKVKRRSS